MKKTDEDPDAPPGCQDESCTMKHGNGVWIRDNKCPAATERQRYQRRRWARRHPMDAYDRQQRRLRGE